MKIGANCTTFIKFHKANVEGDKTNNQDEYQIYKYDIANYEPPVKHQTEKSSHHLGFWAGFAMLLFGSVIGIGVIHLWRHRPKKRLSNGLSFVKSIVTLR